MGPVSKSVPTACLRSAKKPPWSARSTAMSIDIRETLYLSSPPSSRESWIHSLNVTLTFGNTVRLFLGVRSDARRWHVPTYSDLVQHAGDTRNHPQSVLRRLALIVLIDD